MTEISPTFPDLTVNIGQIHLKNPVFSCSGTFSSGIEYNAFYNISELGAITTKSFSLNKRDGNIPPRIWETASGMLNSIGLQNDGIDYFIKEQLYEIKKLGATVILSIFGDDIEEFVKIAKKIKKVADELVAIEINFSCPNVKNGGMAFCAVPSQIKQVVLAIKDLTDVPLIAKLSPNHNTISESTIAACEGGAEAVSIINTMVGTAFDIETFKPRLGNITGGLSGPAIKPVALANVYELSKMKILPIIGMGGISCWQDAVEFLIAGASAVGIGTINFVEPDAGIKIIEGIRGYMVEKNIASIRGLIGAAQINNDL